MRLCVCVWTVSVWEAAKEEFKKGLTKYESKPFDEVRYKVYSGKLKNDYASALRN